MNALYFDCFSGISGNMIIGAMLDAGMPFEHLEAELTKLPVKSYSLVNKEVTKQGIKARYFNVKVNQWFQSSRNLADISGMIDSCGLSDFVKSRAQKVFARLAAAEAKVHGVPVQKIHFHEVGAVDSIVDIVGIMIGLEFLGVQIVHCSELHVGSGFVKCSHGLMPVPAPATAELLQGIPFYSGEIKGELVTPTGAAFVATAAERYGAIDAGFQVERVAYGAGSMDLAIPNLLRMYVGTLKAPLPVCRKTKIVETNIDDLNPQVYGYVMDRLFAAGANDAYLTPVIMKKGRPGTKISVIAPENKVAEITELILRETTTLGVRVMDCETTHLERDFETVNTLWGDVRVKVARLDGVMVNAAPEYGDCKLIAELNTIPLKMVQQQAMALFWARCQAAETTVD
jgi:uncharacterized protein (TIGR00299 family) protein